MQELQGQSKRPRQNNANIGDLKGFMPELINLGRSKKQKIQAERSCTNAALTKDPEINRSKSVSEGGREDHRTRPEAHAHKVYLEYPCDNGNKMVTAFPPRDIVYKQDKQLFGFRDKPITQQDALPKSEGPPRYLPGQDPLSLSRHPLCHPTLADYQSACIDEVETSTVDPDAITV
ncbi:hypothetical protein V6N12_058051 [Hibiscus sabdariffa]|uniref:Uncharacterized protein n=1 Tax=Hibiscus sabdariffa TaxID=183260 RepID=A0ABR2BEU4_9ROSI